ncbi:glycosyltransferase family 2 protein [Mariniphaga sediminis]|uniref:glycosyltransferase family 2 protein n=1 Tax=Mariniphaga sediminis TaxID=1628158 RepID=UPI001559F8D2|nr:glycosyltransferase family 2 protein [Mariniphaga sediminis]
MIEIQENTHKIAVLLTCFNRREKTLSCLNSLFGASMPEPYVAEVFLVDDGSTDGTGKAVKEQYPQVNIISGNGDLFWNRGMNLAWKTAAERKDFDFYLWLNDDVVLHEDSIEMLMQDFQKTGTQKAIVVGACCSQTGEATYSGYVSLRKKRMVKPTGEVQLCDYFNGNVVLIPTPVFEKVGFMDPVFHHGQGDFDYGLRAQKVGINSWVSSGFVGVCERHSELPRWCNPAYSLLARWKSFKSPLGGRPKSTFIFQRKYMGLPLAMFHYFTIHLRLIFPKIWYLKSND